MSLEGDQRDPFLAGLGETHHPSVTLLSGERFLWAFKRVVWA